MNSDLDINSTMQKRHDALKLSTRIISLEELKSLVEEIFAGQPSHPWKESLDQFLRENPYGTFYHGKTNDKVQIVYCREKEKGFWYLPGGGMGILLDKGIAIMKEVTSRG